MFTPSGTSTKNSENILRDIYDFNTDAINTISPGFNPVTGATDVLNIGGNLVPDQYNSIALTYVASGNGIGQIATATYSLNTSVVATLTLSYESSSRLISVVRS